MSGRVLCPVGGPDVRTETASKVAPLTGEIRAQVLRPTASGGARSSSSGRHLTINKQTNSHAQLASSFGPFRQSGRRYRCRLRLCRRSCCHGRRDEIFSTSICLKTSEGGDVLAKLKSRRAPLFVNGVSFTMRAATCASLSLICNKLEICHI